jgi:hypothetical protein
MCRLRLLLIACLVVGAADARAGLDPIPPDLHFVDHAGFRFSYRAAPVPDGLDGIIEVFRPEGGTPVFRMGGLPPPGCMKGDFAEPAELTLPFAFRGKPEPVRLTVLCGSDEGRRQTLFFFRGRQFVAKLEFETAFPNAKWNEATQSVVSTTYLRLPSMAGGLANFMVIYEWSGPAFSINRDAFHASFGARFAEEYWSYYHSLKPGAKDEFIRAAMLAALVSTGDPNRICPELNDLESKFMSRAEIRQTLDFVQRYGYPAFNPDGCHWRQ